MTNYIALSEETLASRLSRTHRNLYIDSGVPPEDVSFLADELNLTRSITASESEKLTGHRLPGLLMTITDVEGTPYLCKDGIQFFRLRPDYSDADRELARKERRDLPKYLSRSGEGCRPYFSAIQNQKKQKYDWFYISQHTKVDIWEVEGERKADSLCAAGFPAIGFSGVDAWRDRRPEKGEAGQLPELGAVVYKRRTVYLCFDSDILSKREVQAALLARAKALQSMGAYVYVVVLPNEIDGSKNGVDDFIARHGVESLKRLQRYAPEALVWKGGKKNKEAFLNPLIFEPKLVYQYEIMRSLLYDKWAYRPGIGWYEWNGRYWQHRPVGEIKALCCQVEESQYWQEGRNRGTMLSILDRLECLLMVKDEQWNAGNRVFFANGVYDYDTDEFRKDHRPIDYSTYCLEYEYSKVAGCDIFLDFLNYATAGSKSVQHLIQAMLRWILCPKNRSKPFPIQNAFTLIGKSETGKGTLLGIIQSLVGASFCVSYSSRQIGDPNLSASFLDKKVAIEWDGDGFLGNPGIFNSIVSNEPIPMKRLYQDMFDAPPGVVLVRGTNVNLEMPGRAIGYGRRDISIPFNQPLRGFHRPPSFIDEIKASELPGIYLWAFAIDEKEMVSRIRAANDIPEIAKAKQENYLANNPEFTFLQEKYPHGSTGVNVTTLYKKYQEWCRDESGIPPKKRSRLTDCLEEIGATKKRLSSGIVWILPEIKENNVSELIKSASTPVEFSIDPANGQVEQPETEENNVSEPIKSASTPVEFSIDPANGQVEQPETEENNVSESIKPASTPVEFSIDPANGQAGQPEFKKGMIVEFRNKQWHIVGIDDEGNMGLFPVSRQGNLGYVPIADRHLVSIVAGGGLTND